MEKIHSFTDLNAWKKGHEMVIKIYDLTKAFPQEEIFGLTNQLRRASVSVTSNIAEGFSRTSYKEKAQFYATALGSLTEIQNQILIAKDVGYMPKNSFEELAETTVTTSKLLNGLLKKTRTIIQTS